MPAFLLAFLNPAKILEFFLKYWKQLIVVGILLFMAFQQYRINSLKDNITDLNNNIASLTSHLKTCANSNKMLADTMDARNAEIQKWKDVSVVLEKKNKDLKANLQVKRKKTNKHVVDVLNDQTPKTCEGAIQYLRDGIKEITPW